MSINQGNFKCKNKVVSNQVINYTRINSELNFYEENKPKTNQSICNNTFSVFQSYEYLSKKEITSQQMHIYANCNSYVKREEIKRDIIKIEEEKRVKIEQTKLNQTLNTFQSNDLKFKEQVYTQKNSYTDRNSYAIIPKNLNLECRYSGQKTYIYYKFQCCQEIFCCIYCHMDVSNHRINVKINQIYCSNCNRFSQNNYNKCSTCNFQSKNTYDIKKIAMRCRFYKNLQIVEKKSCCNLILCCIKCHDSGIDHSQTTNSEYFCINCSSKVQFYNEECSTCGNHLKNCKEDYYKTALKCKYYENIKFIYKYQCCLQPYCCSKCHKLCQKHSADLVNPILICIECEEENTSSENNHCRRCKRALALPEEKNCLKLN